MGDKERNRAALKKGIVYFLQQTKRHSYKEIDFWNDLSVYLKKPLVCKNYGVSKMKQIFSLFSDVVVCEKGRVQLVEKQRADDGLRQGAAWVISDSDEDEVRIVDNDGSTSTGPSVGSSRPGNSRSHPVEVENFDNDTVKSQIISLLRREGGVCNYWKFLELLSSEYGTLPAHPSGCPLWRVIEDQLSSDITLEDETIALKSLPPSERVVKKAKRKGEKLSQTQSCDTATSLGESEWTKGLMQPNNSARVTSTPGRSLPWGSASLMSMPGRESQASPADSNNSAMPNFLSFSGGNQSSSSPQPAHQRYTLPTPTGLAGANQQSPDLMPANRQPFGPPGPRPMLPPSLAGSPFRTPSPMGANQRPPVMMMASLMGANQMLMSNVMGTNQMAMASPALVVRQNQSTVTEFPTPRKRTGPPAGTKKVEETRLPNVVPIQLPRGARLTADAVNHEIKDCIEVIAASGHHVSLEAVEARLLQKYGVPDFRFLNLREKLFHQMTAARDHSMLLGKVNAYIQNFARSRSLCTLYELRECCREFHPQKKGFDHLNLGPLQAMPLIYEYFKFPHDEYIPEITTGDVLEMLDAYLSKTNSWTSQVSVEELLTYLKDEVHHVESAFSLGIRIRSLPLAIQMLKKSKRDAAVTRRDVIETLKLALQSDIDTAFQSFRAEFLQKSSDGADELRTHYLNLDPDVCVREILSKFELLAHLLTEGGVSNSRNIAKYTRHFHQFVDSVLMAPLPRSLFQLSVCLSSTEVSESAREVMEQEAERSSQDHGQHHTAEPQRQTPASATVADKVVTYINRCLEKGPLHLSHLQKIEDKVLSEFKFQHFTELTSGQSFLDFLHSSSPIKRVLDECGGTALGSSAGSEGEAPGFKPQLREVLEFVRQAKEAGAVQTQHLEKALCDQFSVSKVKQLGFGNMPRLMTDAEKPGKHVSKEYRALYEAALCGKACPVTRHSFQEAIGIQGSQSRVAAMACLTSCPLLEDLAVWSHWPLVFQPQHGPLRDFVEKYGGHTEIPLQGGQKLASSDFLALEVDPGRLLKLSAVCTPGDFVSALEVGDATLSAGVLASLVVANKGIEHTQLALMATQVRGKLTSLHAQSPLGQSPGGPPQVPGVGRCQPNLAVLFVRDVLLCLPLRLCVTLANQVLLEPLSQVVGLASSKRQLGLSVAGNAGLRERLEVAGCLLGIQEWVTSFSAKCQFPSDCLKDMLKDDLLGGDEEFEVDEEEEEEDDDDDESSDIDEILSGDDNEMGDTASKEMEEEVKGSKPPTLGAEEEEDSSEDDDSEEEGEEEKDEDVDKKVEKKVHQSEGEGEHQAEGKEGVSSDDEDEDSEESDDEEEEEEENLSPTEQCRRVVESIRRDEFGEGIPLDETGKRLLLKQQERQGRSLQRLSKDLYSKETHFVLELIQNADDNSYTDTRPAVKFVIEHTGVTVMNNETGFEERNIRALCDVGKSTKEKHKYGYIGQKGIGFKSVFRVTGRPEIHSNYYHICFDVDSGPMGYILPHWIGDQESSQCEDSGWETRIVLPWTEEIKPQVRTHAARFNDIQPSLLLFLHRLKEITIENKVEGTELRMMREDKEGGEIQIAHSEGTDHWLVLRKVLDASNISLMAKSGVEVESTEIALAFPLTDRKMLLLQAGTSQPKMPVFAFLPLRTYGFRFIIQGDFDVPSSREDVDRDSSWNQWLRNEYPALFLDALEAFKARPELSAIEALVQFMQFVPLEGEVIDFFKPVASHILKQLKDKACMPVLSPDKKDTVVWRKPIQTVVSQDSLLQEVVPPGLLHHQMGLYFLHHQVALALDRTLLSHLGVDTLTAEHLMGVGTFVAHNWDGSGSPDQVCQISKWLACIYRSLDDLQENTSIIERLRKLKVIPLSNGDLVALEDVTVFLLTEAARTPHKATGGRNALAKLRDDLAVVHPALTSTEDREVNSQVVKLLQKADVKQLTASDLIHCHILPALTSEDWKVKGRDVLISYMIYIKEEMERNPSILDPRTLRPLARLATNRGLRCPSEEDVHFSVDFGNKVDLPTAYPGQEWILVDSGYLPSSPSRRDLQTWRDFLSSLGVVDFLRVREVEVTLDPVTLQSTVWKEDCEGWPESPEGYLVQDFQCPEFDRLVSKGQYQEMVSLFGQLASGWEAIYGGFVHAQLRSPSGHVLKREIKSTFGAHLQSLAWVPAQWQSTKPDPDGVTATLEGRRDLQLAADLYCPSGEVQNLLAHFVKYLDVPSQSQDTAMTNFLQIKTSVGHTAVKNALVSWSNRGTEPQTPRILTTTVDHMTKVYTYLYDNLSRKDTQDLFQMHPTIFVPVGPVGPARNGCVVGSMLSRSEVWWEDGSQLFATYHSSLKLHKHPLAQKTILRPLYQSLQDMFLGTARVPVEASPLELTRLAQHIARVQALTQPNVLEHTLTLFSLIGAHLAKADDTEAGIPTNQALEAQQAKGHVLDLLTSSAMLPTKQGQWVKPSDQPMIADSPEMEEMFTDKPGVFFLALTLPKSGHRRQHQHRHDMLEPKAIEHLVSLCGDSIRPLSECLTAKEISTGFQPWAKGQLFFHQVAPFIQRFLYFLFPDEYSEFLGRDDRDLAKLTVVEVEKLEVRYELTAQPDIYEIRNEKSIVKENHFYFHREAIESQSEIIKEVAKYFSEGSTDCLRELRSFLSQAVPILEGTSKEPMEDLLSRQRLPIGEMPEEEELWQVSPPVILPPQVDEPQMEEVGEEMPEQRVYGRALSGQDSSDSAVQPQESGGEGSNLKSWPPRSGVDVDVKASDGTKKKKASTLWPPPEPPSYRQTLLSQPVQANDGSSRGKESSAQGEGNRSHGGVGSQLTFDSPQGRQPSRQHSKTDTDSESGQARTREENSGPRTHQAGAARTDPAVTNTGEKREPPKGKRTLTDGSEEDIHVTKRLNSLETDPEHSQETLKETSESQHNERKDGSGFLSFGTSAQPDTPRPGFPHLSGHTQHAGRSQSLDRPRDKHGLNLASANWNNCDEDIPYIDLAEGETLTTPTPVNSETSEVEVIGRLGEEVVREYLLKLKEDKDSNVLEVIWPDQDGRQGLPYDFELICKARDSDAQYSVYIEVKATLTDSKEIFPLSLNQIKFAMDKGDKFKIYRLFRAGQANRKLVRIDNIAERMYLKEIRLWMRL